jgi:cardiolipin synthase
MIQKLAGRRVQSAHQILNHLGYTPIKLLTRKFFPSLVISGILFFYAWLVFAASHIALPDPENPILLYSNQTRHDIKLTYCQALKEANQSIYLSVYGISDPQILSLLCKKGEKEFSLKVEFDPSASANLKKLLPPSAAVKAVKSKGLMHRKIAVLDHARIFLGSANLTTTSLSHHSNLVMGLYSPDLAEYLENPGSVCFFFEIQGQKGEIYLLPDPEKSGIKRLLDQIGKARKKIHIAMFTLTHPEIAQALIQAKNRGLNVSIAVDFYTAKGASKKTLAAMQKQGLKIYLSQGRELLHHKWAIIDDTTLVMGSANWTKAAFTKNHDFLLFLSPLTKHQVIFLNKLWKIIEDESIQSIETNQSN